MSKDLRLILLCQVLHGILCKNIHILWTNTCSFQLFEMGLELSLARLKALAKFAFGMGLTQVYLVVLDYPSCPCCFAYGSLSYLTFAIDYY